MQSKKRFVETNLWEAAWFMELEPIQKLFWRYINDRCDNIGIWEPNFKLAAFYLPIKGDPDDFGVQFLKAVNSQEERIVIIDKGYWFLQNFVKFQYCKGNSLSARSNAHKSYLRLMKKREMWEWFCENQPEVMPPDELEEYTIIYPKPALGVGYTKGTHTYKEKEKEADKEEAMAQDTVRRTG